MFWDMGHGTRDKQALRAPRHVPSRVTGQGGFTLVELVVVAAILLVLGGGLLTTLLSGQLSYLSADAYIQVQEEARKAFSSAVRELREACGTTIALPQGNPGPQLDFQVALGYDLDGVVAGCPDAAVCCGARDQQGIRQQGWQVRYRVSGTQLLREVLSGGAVQNQQTRVLANNVVAAPTSFAWNPAATARAVTVTLQVQRQDPRLPGGGQTIGTTAAPLRSQVRLRNP